MPKMKILHVCLFLVNLSAPSFAEDKQQRGVKVIDDAIWETKKADSGPDTVESATGVKRYKGAASNSTTDKEQERADRCAINNERGSPGFRDCYRKDERTEVETRRATGKSVEQRAAASEGPAVPLVEETKKAPVFKEDD